MTNVNIFFACSAQDLHEDSLEIQDFIRYLNDRYIERSLQFRITVCEEENIATEIEKQQKDDQDICESQLFVIVLFKDAAKYTIEKFDVAYNHFKETDTPAILTFFRTDGSEPTEEVQNFMNRLDQELGHYFKTYSDIDALKLYLLMQIMNMGMDTEIEFYNGQALVTGEPILSLEHLPELAKNVDLRIVQEKIDKAEQEYLEAKTKFRNEDNDENYKALNDARKRRDNFIEQRKQAEKSILKLTQQALADCVKGRISLRRQQAIRLLEQGDSHAAYEIYDMNDICADFDQASDEMHLGQQMMELAKEKATQYVADILEKIDILLTFQDMEPEDQWQEVKKLYEIAVEKERDMDLDRIATKRYMYDLSSCPCNYYCDFRDFDRCEQITRQYLQYANSKGDQEEIRSTEFHLALVLFHINNFTESEKLFRKLLETCYDPNEEAALCHNLANLLEFYDFADEGTEDLGEIISLRRRALNIARESNNKDQKTYEMNLSDYCCALGASLEKVGDDKSQKEAESLIHEGWMLWLGIAKRDPIAFNNNRFYNMLFLVRNLPKDDEDVLNEIDAYFHAKLKVSREQAKSDSVVLKHELARDCYLTAELLSWYRDDPESRLESESLYNEALEAECILVQNGMSPYGEFLASQYSELAASFHEGENKKRGLSISGEDLYREVLKIWRGLAEKVSPDFKTFEANSCNCLAVFLAKQEIQENHKEAESLYREALKIRRELAENGFIQSKDDVASSCNNLADFLAGQKEAESQQEAEKLYREALDIRRRLANEDQAYEANLAFSCNNLAVFLMGRKDAESQKETESLFREALEIRRGIADGSSEQARDNLAFSCLNLANFLSGRRDAESWKEAEKLYREALEIRRILKENPPIEFFVAEENLAFTCMSFASFLDVSGNEDFLQEAESLYREALEIRRNLMEENPTYFMNWDETTGINNLCISCTNLALFLEKQNDIEKQEEAESLYREALEIRRNQVQEGPVAFNDENRPSDYNNLAVSCTYLANFLNKRNDSENKLEAENLYDEVLEIDQKLFQNNPMLYAKNLSIGNRNLADLLFARDDEESWEKLEGLLRDILKSMRTNPDVFDELDIGNVCFSLAIVLQRKNNADCQQEAEELYREALKIARKVTEENPVAYGNSTLIPTCRRLASLLTSRDDVESQKEAESLLDEVDAFKEKYHLQ